MRDIQRDPGRCDPGRPDDGISAAGRAAAPGVHDVDLLDLDRWAREGAPHAWFATLRREDPVHHHRPASGGPGFWVITRYDDVVALGRCPHVLSSDDDNGGVVGLGPGDALQEMQDAAESQTLAFRSGGSNEGKMLLTLDPPEHTAYRKIVNRAFTPRSIAALEGKVRELVVDLLDRRAPGEVQDFTTEFAMPLPMNVIADMIGAPREDHEQIMRWSNQVITSSDPEYAPPVGGAFGSALALFQYFTQLRLDHEERPADDICTALLRAEVDGHGLSPLRFNMFMLLLSIAGNETTRTALSHAAHLFSVHPEQWDRLRHDPSLIPSAVEEVLRYSSPVMYFRRNALAPVEVAGREIQAGDIVSLWYVSANRDEDHFDDPQTFDVGRTPNHHVAFGGGGPHFCLGASLARLELRVALEELVARCSRIEQVGELSRVRANFLQGIKHLPVRLHP